MAAEPHPSSDTALDSLRSFTLGVVAGLRSATPAALLARELSQQGPDIADGGWVLDLFARRRVGLLLAAGALFELIADKLPFTPSRLMPASLAVRVAIGGTVAGVQSLAEGRASDRGALLGSLGAVGGSAGGYWLRMRLSRVLPPLLAGLLEDVLALGLGAWAVRR